MFPAKTTLIDAIADKPDVKQYLPTLCLLTYILFLNRLNCSGILGTCYFSLGPIKTYSGNNFVSAVLRISFKMSFTFQG